MTTARWTSDQLEDYRRKHSARKPDTSSDPPAEPRQAPARPVAPNQTERQALAVLNLREQDMAFEGRTFDVCGGSRYTPDWIDADQGIAIEVKGEHVHSRDSRCRFDEARTLYPSWRWIWIRKRTTGRKGKRWEVEVYG